MESWSVGKHIAYNFSGSRAKGSVVVADVPVLSIVGTARTGFGCLTEGEVVTVGALGRVRILDPESIPESMGL